TLTVRSFANGVWSEQTTNVSTDGSGKASYTTPQYARFGPSQVTQVQIVVIGVQVPAGYVFDGTKPTVTVDKP
ncbi:MAG TPA: hypothetical protein VK461_05335, partial [Acidimicrobiales bacterium]|nr:hypothetical protein [Acidimicrobiales bacterium]